jgi:hypothetical protein
MRTASAAESCWWTGSLIQRVAYEQRMLPVTVTVTVTVTVSHQQPALILFFFSIALLPVPVRLFYPTYYAIPIWLFT